MNGRGFTRVHYSTQALIKYGNNIVCGTASNLSLKGMYLKTDYDIPANIPVHISIYHSNHSLKFDAVVVRRDEHGIGLQINRMDVNSFARLRDIVSENSKELTLVAQESYMMQKCIY
ncbi:MAG: PilZ domain-containing protein [Desulfuromonadaceae bacterium]|nr:PilZ domain-containing protein [Desulfuromonadaceae bacterium]MDD5105213.1 PilZ domain-containing protein [Desulfuromonadaceae bacterium]